jgi:hypothetical protein
MVRVTDARAHCEHARSHGALIATEPTDFPYGERVSTAPTTRGDTIGRSPRRSQTSPPKSGAVAPSRPNSPTTSLTSARNR